MNLLLPMSQTEAEKQRERLPEEGEITFAQRVKLEALKQGVRIVEFSHNDCKRISILRGTDGTFTDRDSWRVPSWSSILTNPNAAFLISGNARNAGNVVDLLEKFGTFLRQNPRLPKGSKSQLTFRAVKAPYRSELTVDEMVRKALSDGGKAPDDNGIGSWFADNKKVDEYFEGAFTGNDSMGPSDYVLFIYDKDKLEPLADDEINDDYARHWKLKPKSGHELKDCLVGAMIFRGE